MHRSPALDMPDVPKGQLPPHLELQRTRVLCNFDAPTHVLLPLSFFFLVFFCRLDLLLFFKISGTMFDFSGAVAGKTNKMKVLNFQKFHSTCDELNPKVVNSFFPPLFRFSQFCSL